MGGRRARDEGAVGQAGSRRPWAAAWANYIRRAKHSARLTRALWMTHGA
jgi:hypothetical protein